jgi:replicative DNA helicase
MNKETREAVEATEGAALGAAILDANARAGIVGGLTPDAFLREAHRTMFETIVAMHGAGEHVDQITLNDRFARTGRLDEVGGLAAVWTLTSLEGCPSPASWPIYVRIVAREHARRVRVGELRAELAELEAPS